MVLYNIGKGSFIVSILNLLNATFNPQYLQQMNSSKNLSGSNGVKAQPKQNGEKGNQTPSFGIKGREPLTADTFQRSGENQGTYFEYKGQKLSKKEAQAKSYSDVYRHEAAHLAKAGQYATTGICIDYDKNGIATSGHVGVALPSLNKSNPDKTIKHAEAVIASAEAPASFDELSDADKNVAAAARSVLSEAQTLKSQNNGQKDKKPLNLLA